MSKYKYELVQKLSHSLKILAVDPTTEAIIRVNSIVRPLGREVQQIDQACKAAWETFEKTCTDTISIYEEHEDWASMSDEAHQRYRENVASFCMEAICGLYESLGTSDF